MSSLDHTITGNALAISLEDEIRLVRADLAAATERIGRTVLKNGPLRVTLVALKPGGALPSHRSEGPITVQVLEGTMEVRAGEANHRLPPGAIFALAGGIQHSVLSEGGGIFLLTLVTTQSPS